MNTKHFLPLAAAFLLAATIIATLAQDPAIPTVEASPRIVDLAAVSVRPAIEDAAYYQSRKVVDLDAVTVHPEPGDLASFVTASVRAVDCLC